MIAFNRTVAEMQALILQYFVIVVVVVVFHPGVSIFSKLSIDINTCLQKNINVFIKNRFSCSSDK